MAGFRLSGKSGLNLRAKLTYGLPTLAGEDSMMRRDDLSSDTRRRLQRVEVIAGLLAFAVALPAAYVLMNALAG